MGILNLFAKPAPALVRLPAGSFTVGRDGRVLTSTLLSGFPAELVKDIARQALAAFSEAATAQLPLAELTINYSSLRITARELRGGAIVFLSPRAPASPMKQR